MRACAFVLIHRWILSFSYSFVNKDKAPPFGRGLFGRPGAELWSSDRHAHLLGQTQVWNGPSATSIGLHLLGVPHELNPDMLAQVFGHTHGSTGAAGILVNLAARAWPAKNPMVAAKTIRTYRTIFFISCLQPPWVLILTWGKFCVKFFKKI